MTGINSMKRNLNRFFEPTGVAIIGASTVPYKPGFEVVRNILANGYAGGIYPVNPKGDKILGFKVYPSIDALPEGIELAIIILPAESCPQALSECTRKGITHFVLSAGGFAEVDEPRAQIQQDLLRIIQETGASVLGPNTSGHISTPHCLTSTFFPLGKVRSGAISYVAQTGNFATHTMKYILTAEHFGVARVIGLGNKIDIDESDALEYLGGDSETKAILMYLESIKRPERFLRIARNVTRAKPVIVLKGASTEGGKKAAIAHTAALAQEDRIVGGLLRQAGAVQILEYTHLVLAGKALSMAPLPMGNRIALLAPSGAMLVVLTDLAARLGLEIPELAPETVKRLQEISPPFIRMRNPVDISPSVTTKGFEFGYREGMEAVLKDPGIDAVVSILRFSEGEEMPPFDFIHDLVKRYREKPVFIGFSGEKKQMDHCKAFLEPLGVPTFQEIEQPLEVLSILARCRYAMGRPPGAT
jgi:acetate---CoA ligase (ADP-forming)